MLSETNYSDGKLVISRLYTAAQQAVFDAWIEAEQVQNWWGCADTTNVESDIETKVGGKYEHQMTLRGQYQHVAQGVFTEYDPPNVLAYTINGPEEAGDTGMHVRVEFKSVEGGTQVTLTHTGIPHEFSPFIVDGWTAAFGKLFRFLFEQAQAA